MNEKIQFVLDENLSPKLADTLCQLGYLTKPCREVQLLGKNDFIIVEWAIKNNAIIITCDREFGELWYWYYSGKLNNPTDKLDNPADKLGIIVLCLSSQSLEGQKKVIEYLHRERVLLRSDLVHCLIISTESRYRIRKGL